MQIIFTALFSKLLAIWVSKSMYDCLIWYFTQFYITFGDFCSVLDLNKIIFIKCSQLQDLLLYKMKDLLNLRNMFSFTINSLNWGYTIFSQIIFFYCTSSQKLMKFEQILFICQITCHFLFLQFFANYSIMK